jgi:hypothetical protein
MQEVLIREVVFIILLTWFGNLLVDFIWYCVCVCVCVLRSLGIGCEMNVVAGANDV